MFSNSPQQTHFLGQCCHVRGMDSIVFSSTTWRWFSFASDGYLLPRGGGGCQIEGYTTHRRNDGQDRGPRENHTNGKGQNPSLPALHPLRSWGAARNAKEKDNEQQLRCGGVRKSERFADRFSCRSIRGEEVQKQNSGWATHQKPKGNNNCFCRPI